MRTEWRGFKGNNWKSEVNIRDFIQNNYTSYDGDESFLVKPTKATEELWETLKNLQKEERSKGKLALLMDINQLTNFTKYSLNT